MADRTVYETNRRAAVLGLSFAQMRALDWLAEKGETEKLSFRNAGFATKTVNSLTAAKLVECKSVHEPRWRVIYVMTDAGRAAITRAGVVAHIRMAKPRRHRCCAPACYTPATIQCDYQVAHGKTCDAWCCRAHAASVGADVDHCPAHSRAQGGLFTGLMP